MFPKGGMGGLYKKAQQMQKEMANIQSELDSMEVKGSSGGDAVNVVVSGKKKLLSIDINQDAISVDKDMLEDLILVAINQANDEVDRISKEKMGSLTGGMNIPGMF